MATPRLVLAFVASFGLIGLAGGQAVRALDLAEREGALRQFVEAFRAEYVFADYAEKGAAMIESHVKSHDYDAIKGNDEFAKLVTAQLRDVCKDAHLEVTFSEKTLPERKVQNEPSNWEVEQQRALERFTNDGFELVRRLPGNIGYMDVRAFSGDESAKLAIEGAFDFVANADALIVDLRENQGGDPEAVRLFCSYFFDETPVHLNDLVGRNGKLQFASWTLKRVAGSRFRLKPVFLLSCKKTASAAEECAYDLQTLKRATVVGESTWGGANPGEFYRLSDHFGAFIPTARARNPYTNMNWEGSGVIPDVKCLPEKALPTAQIEALKLLISRSNDLDRRAELKNLLEELQKGPPAKRGP